MKKFLLLFTFLFVLSTVSLDTSYADDGYMGAIGTNPIPQNSQDIVMVDEIINIKLYQDWHDVHVVYSFKNEGSAQNVIMGFPEKVDRKTNDMQNFRAFVGGKEVSVKKEKRNIDTSLEWEVYENWYVQEIYFQAGETKQIINTYQGKNGASAGITNDFEYILKTGATWKNAIGTLDIVVDLMDVDFTNFANFKTKSTYNSEYGYLEGIGAYPDSYQLDKTLQQITWHLENVEPTYNLNLQFYTELEMRCNATDGGYDENCWSIVENSPHGYTYTASSFLTQPYADDPQNAFSYKPANLANTWAGWCEAEAGFGNESKVRIDFGEKKHIEQLVIKNGLQNDNVVWTNTPAQTYAKNNRVKKALLFSENDTMNNISLADTMEPQYINITPIDTSYIEFMIVEDVYKGTNNNTCMTYLGITPYQHWKTTYHNEASWVSQTEGEWPIPSLGTAVSAHEIIAGGSKSIVAQFKNIGIKTWKNSGPERLGFYVYKDLKYSYPPNYNNPKNPLFGSSLFSNTSWLPSFDGNTPNACAATLQESAVKPGEIGTFAFTFSMPDTLIKNTDDGFFREDLSLAVGPHWMHNVTNGDPLSIAHVWFPLRVRE